MATKKIEYKTVEEFLKGLDDPMAEVIKAIRKIILSTDKEIGEQIKWNSPCFIYTGDMKPFNPKEYKRDIAVVNIHRGYVLLVFPTGAIVKDDSGLLEGDYKDGRRLAKFMNVKEVKAREKDLKKLIKAWLMMVDK
jgi:hypothetical protein